MFESLLLIMLYVGYAILVLFCIGVMAIFIVASLYLIRQIRELKRLERETRAAFANHPACKGYHL